MWEIRNLREISSNLEQINKVSDKYTVNINNICFIPVWRDRIRRLAPTPVVMRLSPATDIIIYVVHCWLINPNKLNLLSWLLAYLSDE